ncbi:MAG: GntR family transcriptional regulator [Limnohabitans sp.]
MPPQNEITQRVVESILAQKLAPGERLGEQELADVFGVSRTLVREALMQLQARGFVDVRPRKGWYVVEPSLEEARDAFSARKIIEAGLIPDDLDQLPQGVPLQQLVRRLRDHIHVERQAIADNDVAHRSFVLADFHICLAECLGHRLLSNVLRDLTARTTLVASLYQSSHDATQSCDEHEEIVQAMESGNMLLARKRMLEHIDQVGNALGTQASRPASRLDTALQPLGKGPTSNR